MLLIFSLYSPRYCRYYTVQRDGGSLVVFVLKKVSLVPLDLNKFCVYILCK